MDSLLYEDEPVVNDEPAVKASITSMYPEWHAEAKCLGEQDQLFFGASEPDVRPPYTLADIKRAKDLCGGCPVAAECLRAALCNREEYGVWAGTTRKQRSRMLAAIDAGQVSIDALVTAFEENREQ